VRHERSYPPHIDDPDPGAEPKPLTTRELAIVRRIVADAHADYTARTAKRPHMSRDEWVYFRAHELLDQRLPPWLWITGVDAVGYDRTPWSKAIAEVLETSFRYGINVNGS